MHAYTNHAHCTLLWNWKTIFTYYVLLCAKNKIIHCILITNKSSQRCLIKISREKYQRIFNGKCVCLFVYFSNLSCWHFMYHVDIMFSSPLSFFWWKHSLTSTHPQECSFLMCRTQDRVFSTEMMLLFVFNARLQMMLTEVWSEKTKTFPIFLFQIILILRIKTTGLQTQLHLNPKLGHAFCPI